MIGIGLIAAAGLARLTDTPATPGVETARHDSKESSSGTDAPGGATVSYGAIAYAIAALILAAFMAVSIVHVRVWRNSVTLYTAAMAANPRAYSAPTNLGAYYIVMQQFDKAIAPLEVSVRDYPGDVMSIVNLADVYRYTGRFELAKSMYTRALSLSPTDSHANFGLGVVLLRAGRASEALGHFQSAASDPSVQLQARMQVAQCTMHLKEYDQAVAAYKSVLASNPALPEVWLDLAVADIRAGHQADAAAAAQQAENYGAPKPAVDRYLAMAGKSAGGAAGEKSTRPNGRPTN
jgi:Tfp pilus assembly protein PilF